MLKELLSTAAASVCLLTDKASLSGTLRLASAGIRCTTTEMNRRTSVRCN